jgi:hypothetical protein
VIVRRRRGAELEEALLRAAWDELFEQPFDLFRHEAMMTLGPVPDEVLDQILDDVFLPLVTPPD